MRFKAIAGAVAAVLWGGVAMAQDVTTEPQPNATDPDMTQHETQIKEDTYTMPPPAQDEVVVSEREVVVEPKGEKSESAMTSKGMSILGGAGVEGYTGTLNGLLNPGVAWGVTVAGQPLTWFGAEIGYSGAASELDQSISGPGEGAANGADMVRNGGHFAVTLNAPTPYVQPYALAGIGVDRYTFRGIDNGTFRDDTSGRVPLGGGLRTQAGAFVADVRFQYDTLFSQEFARSSPDQGIGGAYTGMLQIGGKF